MMEEAGTTRALLGDGADRRKGVSGEIATSIGPAVSGMTLGIVRQGGFNAQNGRNQAWNHAGNMVGAGLSGWLGWALNMPPSSTSPPRSACSPSRRC